MDTPLTSPFRIGVDVGGTFTDIVVIDAASRIHAFKSPSNPADPAAGVMASVELAAGMLKVEVATLLAGTELFVHGSTIATNVLLEKKGAKVALLATEGFRDSLEIRRGIRRDVWDHRAPLPHVLVPRHRRFPVRGRMDASGNELEPIDREQVRALAAELKRQQVESVAICLLHSYKNADHEHAVASVLETELPGVFICCSADISPTIGEYERSSTVAVNAYVAPRVAPYLRALEGRLAKAGLARGLLIVQSNGGASSIDDLALRPVQMVLSGPSAGAGSLRFFGSDTGSENLVCIEIGGTSCDIMVASGGDISMTEQIEIDDHHLAIPAVEILTVGAGGGTISKLDPAGMLQAGPEGAGARPGPAAYGFGGTQPTVTDAQLVLGRLRAGPYAGGAISLDMERAREAIRTVLAEPLGLSVEAAAAGIIRLVEQNILHAVERMSIERGYNPRDFTLVAAGGAGPLHGVEVGRALGCGAVYIPRLAGVFCAFGMCNADIRHDAVKAWLSDVDAPDGAEAIAGQFEAMRRDAHALLSAQGFEEERMAFRQGMDLRYVGQQWTVPVETPDLEPAAIRKDFGTRYERLFGFHQPEGRIQVANLHLTSLGRIDPVRPHRARHVETVPIPVEVRPVWDERARAMLPTPVYDGRALAAGQTIMGPAVVDEDTTTILFGPGDRLRMTDAANYLVEIN